MPSALVTSVTIYIISLGGGTQAGFSSGAHRTRIDAARKAAGLGIRFYDIRAKAVRHRRPGAC